MKGRELIIRMAEYKIGKCPDKLKTIGLGSCVGIAIYDYFNKIGGLIHIMLPERKGKLKCEKYADSGIPLLVNKMKKKGARQLYLVAKIAGGARMFKMTGLNGNLEVGKRNIEKTRQILSDLNIEIIAEDVGKDYGRTMTFFIENGEVIISS